MGYRATDLLFNMALSLALIKPIYQSLIKQIAVYMCLLKQFYKNRSPYLILQINLFQIKFLFPLEDTTILMLN